jgi:hypothetical protein
MHEALRNLGSLAAPDVARALAAEIQRSEVYVTFVGFLRTSLNDCQSRTMLI